MNFYYLTIILIIFNLISEKSICLKVRTPSIFGRRMSHIDSNLRSVFEANNIVPDVIDTFPLNKIQVRYPSGVDVDLGNELTPKSVKDQPLVEWATQMGQYYTLVMIDPDAPSRHKPSKREIKHWLVINIPAIDITKGETLVVYRGSTPLKGTGLHRYIFLIYKQPGLITHSENVLNSTSNEGRTHFNARVFAKTYNLGEPVGANFFFAQFDEYVGLVRSKNRKLKSRVNPNLKNESEVIPRRAKLIDWAPRKPKAPKFPQMICINNEKYEEIQNLLKENKIN